MRSTNRARAGFLAATVALSGLAGFWRAPADAAAPPPKPHITLVSQTPWVQPGGTLHLALHVDGAKDAGNLELALSTYARLPSRSAFQQTLQDRPAGSLIDVTSTPLNELGVDSAGNFAASLGFQDPALPRDPGRLLLTHDGVYPLRVELREKGGGAVLDRFMTHIPYLPAARTGPKLDVAWVLPVYAPPTLRPDGTRKLASPRDLLTLAQAIEAAPNIPAVIAPNPETMQALASSSDDTASATLASLRRGLARHQVVTAPYVPANLPVVIASGLESDAEGEIRHGADRLDETLRVPVDGTTWVTEEPLDEASMAKLRDLGVTQVALPEASMTPLQQRLTISRPYLLDARQSRRQQAASIDPGLASHFQNTGNQVLNAHHLLADLATLYFDQPGGVQRGVVALTPRSWRPDKGFLDVVMGALNDNPVVDPVNLNTFFGNADKLRGSNGTPLVRRMVAAPRNVSTNTTTRSVRQRLNTFRSIVDKGNPVYDTLDEQLLVSHSADLRSSRQRSYVSGAEKGLDKQLGGIQAPTGGSIRLTARGGQIPVTFRNNTGYPVHVVVTMRSDKLEFPGAPATRPESDGSRPPNEVTRKLDLVRRNETARFSVNTRASGAFPVLVTLASPDGNLVVDRSTLTVRSTAASGVGLLLSAAAGLFLLAWWGRHALHGRRARRLVPA